MTEEQKLRERITARKFQKIGKEIGLNKELSEYSYKIPNLDEVLAAKEELDKVFDCSVHFSWARIFLLGMNFSYTQVHTSNNTRLYNDILDRKKIYLTSYYYPALLNN